MLNVNVELEAELAVFTAEDALAVMRLSGDIGLSEMEDLLGEMTDLVLENKNKVILNLRQVKHMALNAIASLAERNRRFRDLGGEIKLVGLSPYVSNLFKLVGAYSNFDVVRDEEEAVARFAT